MNLPIRLSLKKQKTLDKLDVSGHSFKFWPQTIFLQLLQGFTESSSETLDEDVSIVNYAYAKKYRTW